MKLPQDKPRYSLEKYRDFIRNAAPYVSIVAGRKVSPSEADTMSEKELTILALLIDSRVDDLEKKKK